MKYGELKDKLKETKKQLLSKRKEVDSLKQELASLGSERSSISNRMEQEIKDAKQEAIKAKEHKVSQPFEVKIGKLESKRNQLKQNFDKKMSKINYDEYSQAYAEELEVSNTIQEKVKASKELVVNILGERFSNELFRQLDGQEVELDIDDMKDVSDRLATISKEIERMSYKSKFNIFKKIDDLFDKLNPCKEDDTSSEEYIRKQVIQYLVICGVISIIVVYFLSPYLLIAVFLLGAFNIYRSWRIYSLLLQCKLIDDNLSSIEKVINDKIKDNLKRDKDKLQGKYDEQLEKISAILDRENNNLQDELLNIRSNFLFDDTNIRAKYNINLKGVDDKETALRSSIASTNADIKRLENVIQDLELQLSKATSTLKDYYLSTERISKETILDPLFLFDIKDNKPVFWEHPQTSCLFIYDEDKDVNNFMKLLCLQLLNRLDVFSINIDIWDKRFMGASFQPFTTFPSSMFNIAYNDETINESLEVLTEIISKRVVMIKREFSNIKEYNKKMLELESLTESYRFVFIEYPDDKLLDSDNMVQLLVNGGPVGIYTNIFIKSSQMEELGDKSKSLLNNIGNCYVLNGEEVQPRAKEFLEELYVNRK